jgi:hypothetical protein
MAVRLLGVIVGAAVLLAPHGARAEGETTEKTAEPEPLTGFGVGAQLGFFNPSGFALRGGYGPVAIEAAAGFAVTALTWGSDRNPELKFIAPFEVSPQLLLGDIALTKTLHGSFRVGYRYNVLLGHGGTFGGQIARRWDHWQLEGLWGISVFTQAAQRLRDKGTVPPDTSFNIPPALQYGLTVGIMYYP